MERIKLPVPRATTPCFQQQRASVPFGIFYVNECPPTPQPKPSKKMKRSVKGTELAVWRTLRRMMGRVAQKTHRRG